MKKLAVILGIGSGFLMLAGINPGQLMLLGIVVLVFAAWLRAFAGKRGFNGDFWGALAALLFLPYITQQLMYHFFASINWRLAFALIVFVTIISALLIYTRREKRNESRMSGVERTPLYPESFEHDRWLGSNEITRDDFEVER